MKEKVDKTITTNNKCTGVVADDRTLLSTIELIGSYALWTLKFIFTTVGLFLQD